VKKLRTGTNIIRTLLGLCIALSLAGLLILAQSPPDRGMLAALFLLTIISLVAVIRILVVRKLPKRIRQLSAIMNRAAEGELTERAAFDGETELSLLAEHFNSMMEQLCGAITKVHASLAELRGISSTLRDVSESGVSSAARQADAVKQTSSAIREIKQSITDISASVTDLTSLSGGTADAMTRMSRSLETTTRHLESLVSSVEEVSSSIIEMASAARQIEENTANLAIDTVRTTGLLEEMDQAIKRIGIQATDTSHIAEVVRDDAEEGWKAVDAAIAGMQEIRASSSVTVDAIENLSRRVANIGTILSVIDEVAEQTNLLSLNASIIAAQAGERGKSFSVVAGEIKKLAQRTGSHTREISDIILGIRKETERAVAAITQSEQRIEEGSALSHRSGEALRKIVSGITEASSRMLEINATAVSQAESSEAVQHAMANVAELVEQIARATQEQSYGSKTITAEVGRMRELTREVMNSISSHKESAQQVVAASGEMNTKVAEICEASLLQSGSAERIGASVREIEEAADMHVESSLVIDDILLKLAAQIDLLNNEMGRFRVAKQ
jgi:methyl-accepting chemotaxis protein